MSGPANVNFPLVCAADLEAARAAAARMLAPFEHGPRMLVRVKTIISELGRNVVQHGGGGTLSLALVLHARGVALRIEALDRGPGIADVALALSPGFSTTGGLGLGLSGSRRIADRFEIGAPEGGGTLVTAWVWL